MLGRYIAGTLLVLGVAMLMAPPPPEDDSSGVPVTRSTTATTELVAPPRAEVAAVPALQEEPSTSESVALDAPVETPPDAVETAVLEAMELDLSEAAGSSDIQRDVTETALASLTDTLSLGTASDAEPVELAGLGEPGFFGTEDTGQAPAEAEPASQAQAEAVPLLYVTGERVNVRAGPSTAYRVMGSVSRGELVELVAYEGADWAQIRTAGSDQTGYMSRSFLARSLNDG